MERLRNEKEVKQAPRGTKVMKEKEELGKRVKKCRV